MKKLQIVLLALVAMLTLGAFAAGSASAEVTLVALWLVEGKSVEGTEKIATEIKGKITLEDTKTLAGDAAVLCEGILDGSVLANGESEIAEILNKAGEKIAELGGLALICENEKICSGSGDSEVWPIGLPWLGLVYLMENEEFLVLLTPMTGTEIGYELLCLVVGLNVEDRCTAPKFDILVTNNALTGMAETPGGTKTTPNALCSQSKEETGINETDEESVYESAAGLITVSSE